MKARVILAGVVVLAVAGAVAKAAIPGGDGVIHGCVAKNGQLSVVDAAAEACKSGESPLSWNQTGPTGPQGPPGASLTSLEDVPCDTGNADAPDGRISMSVDAGTGVVTLHCRSNSTNPVLTVGLARSADGALACVPILGCRLFRYAVAEVDGTGVAVANGFTCLPTADPADTQSCTTQRFAQGATVRLAAAGSLDGYAPSWTGCDSVDGTTCTVQLTAARSVTVTPVKTQ